ncbi:MAG: tetratricopeptide repeat protein, partial [Gemmatimonadota bacterium]
MRVGRHEDAERAAREGAGPDAAGVELRNTFGEVLWARGKVEEAEAAFRRAAEGGASDRLEATANLGVLLHRRGERAEARRLFQGFIDVYNRGEARTASDLAAVGTAVRHLGADDPQLFHDAVRAYDRAIAADPDAHEPRLLLADLFLEKYDGAEAQTLYREVLAVDSSHPRALLGMARVRRFDGSPGALELVRRGLEVDPNLVPARLLLARAHLDAEEYDAAESEAERALEVNPASREALAALAAVRYLRDDTAGYDDARRRALALDPTYADLYADVAELAARHRRYHDAVRLAERALALDSASWRAWSELGLNQLRTGRIEAGRASLETAFAGDPFNVWTKNTLDLLDTFDDYRTETTPRFELVLHDDEADLLAPYMAPLAEEAYDRLAERYGYSPETPVRVEVYPRHADFSVRTVGLVGLGALGVSFGSVLAMNSPAARRAGDFNWGSTLWHEIAHAVTLGVTEHRIPRWFAEGLSVLEERRARPDWGWGADATLDYLAAYGAGMLPPLDRLNDAFVRPSYPQQITHAYYQASLIAELIERDHGTGALRAMLEAYREGHGTGRVFRDVLDTSTEAFDDAFDSYMRERFASPLAAIDAADARMPAAAAGAADDDEGDEGDEGSAEGGPVVPRPPDGSTSREEAVRRAEAEPDDFLAQLTAGRALFEADALDSARIHFERAASLFPEYAGADSPYRYLATIHERRDEPRAAADALARLTALNDADYEANVELARLLERLGDEAGAAAALERAVHIDPYDIDVHARLAGLYETLDDTERLVRERHAVVALDPADRAGALYRLARAYDRAGDLDAARREVLRALEIAPGFAEAQELLL